MTSYVVHIKWPGTGDGSTYAYNYDGSICPQSEKWIVKFADDTIENPEQYEVTVGITLRPPPGAVTRGVSLSTRRTIKGHHAYAARG